MLGQPRSTRPRVAYERAWGAQPPFGPWLAPAPLARPWCDNVCLPRTPEAPASLTPVAHPGDGGRWWCPSPPLVCLEMARPWLTSIRAWVEAERLCWAGSETWKGVAQGCGCDGCCMGGREGGVERWGLPTAWHRSGQAASRPCEGHTSGQAGSACAVIRNDMASASLHTTTGQS